MRTYVRVIRFISQLSGFAAAGLIAAGVIIVCQMVFLRYVLNVDTIWQTDFVTYALVAAAFIGSPYVLMMRGHVNVDILPHYGGPRVRWWLAIFASVVTLLFALVITALTFLFWKESWDNRWVSDTMWRARLWIPYAAMPIGLGLLALQCIADLYDQLAGRATPTGHSTESKP
jgi:TRAP-type C4-dicarboxylate transport system permease small subunit